ncbi:MAG: bestrophin family ion channel [Bacteroidota bacterium]
MLITNKIPAKYILSKVKLEIVYVSIIGLLVHFLTTRYKHVIPEMPIAIPAFIGTAISVILSFKLNQSYDRWWEARKIWGSIVNDSRTLILQLQTFLPIDLKNEIKEIAFRHIAWCYSLGQSLRGLNPKDNLEQFVSEKDFDKLKNHTNIPLALLQQNALQIKALKEKGNLDIFSLIQINNTFVNFSNEMGMAERIKSTIFPVTYRLFLHFFIYVFVITLSVALRDIESYYEMPLLLVISLAFFILEKSATHLQDPFMNRPTDTAMTTISRTIEINIKQILEEKEVPEPLKPNGYYAL